MLKNVRVRRVIAALGAGVAALSMIGGAGLANRGPNVGDTAPDFTLTDTSGKQVKLSDVVKQDGVKAVVLEWFNPDCPYVKKHHERNTTMKDTFAQFRAEGVRWLAINSGGAGNQGAGVEHNLQAVKQFKIAYPVLLDESGKVGHSYGATNTPHMFVVNSEMKIIYMGAIDDDRGRNVGKTNYVAEALKAHLSGDTIDTPKTRPYGCGVKYAR